ncbi:MAG: flagellar hook-length control protein FliK [Lachnospiraceae bacterium]|nr:flagellar hook-length control protein FliK [Lachnospiraceae bacterium]
MTSTPVTELQTMYTNVTKTSTASNQIGTFGSSFSEVMSKTGNGTTSGNGEVKAAEKKSLEEPKDAFAKQVSKETATEADKTTMKEENVQDAKPVQKEIAVEDTSTETEVSEVADKIVQAIAEELQVSEEEILKAMETLGLTMLDLLNPNNMAELVLQISGETDMMNLLVNEDLYYSVQTLVETVKAEVASLQAVLGMNDEQFAQLVDELKELATNEQQPQTADVVINNADMTEDAVTVDIAEDTDAENVNYTQKDVSEQHVVSEEDVQVNGELKTTKTAEWTNSQEQQMSEQQDAKGEHSQQPQMTFAQQQTTTVNIAQNAVFAEQNMMPLVSEETKQIMNQIMDYMKLNVTPDVSEMEMQLHPESLGNVKIQLAAKDGIITAQFKAESEMVKAALESQMMQLKETLNEKGVKVEAIEVTVESHAFERNLEQGNEGNNNPEEPQKKSTRRINLNMLENLDELPVDEMEEADKIAAEMMAQAGNTVDFTA